MSDLRLRVLLQAVDRMSSPLRRVAKSFKQTTDRMEAAGKKAAKSMEGIRRGSEAIDRVGKSLALKVSAPILGFGALSLRTAANFELAMNKVGVLTNSTGEDLQGLENMARELGKTTQFSASQAADAMGFLAMAGFDTEKILASLPGTLQLAAAANMELGRAADIVSNVLTGYGMEADEIGRVNDVLVKSFTSANTDLGQFAEAMKIAGPVAKGMNLKFEETAAVIGIMGNAGFQASLAGTALRGALSRLASPAKDVQKALAGLGIRKSDIVDASGELKSFTEIIRVLESRGAKAANLLEIFGERAGPAMAAVLSQGSEAVTGLTAKLQEAGGTAGRVAEAQMKGATGEMRKFRSAVEGLQLAIADSGLLQWFTEFMQRATAWVAGLSESSKTALKWGTIIAGVTAAIAPVLVALASLGFAINGVTVAAGALTAITAPIWGIIAAVLALIAAAGLIFVYWEPIADFFTKLWDGIVAKFKSAIDTIRQGIAGVTNIVPDSVKDFFGFGDDAGSTPQQRAIPAGRGAGGRTEIGGLLKISFDGEGRPQVRELKSKNPDVGISVDTGLAMAGG